MNMKSFATVTGIVAVVALIVMGMWWITMLLWTGIAAGIFGLPEFTYWQPAGAMTLPGILPSGFRAGVPQRDGCCPLTHTVRWHGLDTGS